MWYQDPPAPSRWSAPYVFIAGLVIGIMLGWVFQGIISTLVRFAIIALILVGILYVLNAWRRSKSPQNPDDINEADWRDLNSRRRP
jgi:F0F1-type ATP synthase assembly protein I